MKTIFALLATLALLATGLGLTGCATKPKVDWSSRVGNYTMDQTVVELGPPDRQATLSDGRKVAEWVVGQSGGGGFTFGVGGYGSHTGVGVSQTVGSGTRDKILRLTFGTDGQLAEWTRN
jgi:hypothetical protein